MSGLILYVSLAAVGCVISSKYLKNEKAFYIISKLQTVAIIVLIFSMGSRMGSNEEIVHNLSTIGIYAFVMTALGMAGSVAFVGVGRRLLGYDAFGRRKSEETESDASVEEEAVISHSMTKIIVLTVAAGIAFGYFSVKLGLTSYETVNKVAEYTITYGLCLLLFAVGIDIGKEGTLIQDIKQGGFRLLIVPAISGVGTLAGVLIGMIFVPVAANEALAIGAGFAWYSLAPVIIMEHGLLTVSAISFLYNVFRELFSLVVIPFVAKKFGYIEAITMAGSASMDVCLPIIVKSTRPALAVFSVYAGVVISATVPILVPLFLSM